MLECTDCGVSFSPSGNHRSYRCLACQRAAPLKRLRALNDRRKAAAAEARAGRTCEVCGRPLLSLRSTKRFCRATCRQRARRGTLYATTSEAFVRALFEVIGDDPETPLEDRDGA
jgi:hypothetical protein